MARFRSFSVSFSVSISRSRLCDLLGAVFTSLSAFGSARILRDEDKEGMPEEESTVWATEGDDVGDEEGEEGEREGVGEGERGGDGGGGAGLFFFGSLSSDCRTICAVRRVLGIEAKGKKENKEPNVIYQTTNMDKTSDRDLFQVIIHLNNAVSSAHIKT